jgi:amino acid adenylation domain-containing protein
MPALEPVAEGIAVIGLAGRFPAAPDVAAFWRNLIAGHDGITRFTDEELAAAGYDPAALRTDPGFVPARGILDRPEWFDAAFFGIQPKEAEAIDPQQRVFMETAWHALEDAGCDPTRYAGLIGVYAGMSNNSYARFVRARRDLVDAVGELTVTMGNEKDYLTTRLAYKLNLRGPALSINTACSTSLVALATACQSLASYQCDTALAGGVSITFPQTRGYFFREGGMTSPDGVCRPFDAQAAGAVFSHGCSVVVLKRLADALAEGDQIYAVVKGWALNNDGAGKVSMTAPSIDGQAEVIALAQALAGAAPESIGYVEAHGTGTSLGDAIEVAALTQVFAAETARRQFCALGSLKANVGHLEAASGAAGFIKAALALHHERIPGTPHFATANPQLCLDDSPFYVSPKTIEWPRGAEPRRAGVSSFGVGGTNAHVVLEEAPTQSGTTAGRSTQVLPLSARSATALDQAGLALAAHLEAHPKQSLADAAFTLQTGRQQFAQRRCVVAGSVTEAIAALRAPAKLTRKDDRRDTPIAFLFPGQGSQYPRMGAQLYTSEPTFRAAFDVIADLLQPELGLDLRTAIFSGSPEELRQTRITQPAIFAVEYALAQMWLSFGLRPNALLGHSVGEYVAATLAGVFRLEDAARLVAARARLVQAQPGGAMLAVRLGESDAQEFVSEELSIAAINSSRLCVLSGSTDVLTNVEAELTSRNVPARRLATSHAFHSAMVAPVIAPFTALVRAVPLRAPQIPFVSNITGEWITDAQATDPAYWASHVRAAVRFADGLEKLLDASGRTLLEVGPGNGLTQLARQHPAKTAAHEFAHTLTEDADEAVTLGTAQARLWLAGVPLDWRKVHADETRRRISLPGYCFERQRYFADLPAGTSAPLTAGAADGEPLTTMSPGLATTAAMQTTRAPNAEEAAPRLSEQSALTRLTALLAEQSGTDFTNSEPETTLLDLGFDSLFLSQLIITIQKRFGVRLTILDLFDDLGSLGALAAHLEKHIAPPIVPKAEPTVRPEPAPEIRVVDFDKPPAPAAPPLGPFPLAEAQREVWLACQRGPLASAAFNESCTVQFRGEFKIDAMLRALQTVVDRHETLRTTFSPDGETQTSAPQLTIEVPVEDLSAQPTAERERLLLAWQQAEGTRQFDLTRGPLLAARIVNLTREHHALIFTAHHIACDGWSYDVVLRELGVIYTAYCAGRSHGLSAPMQMSDYQQWESEQQRGAPFAADRVYWLERFKTLPPPLDLPADRARPAQRSHAGARAYTTIPAELYREIAQGGVKLGATPFAMLLAAFKTLLFRLSGEHDFVVGVPAAGQNLAGGADLVGHCVNLLALRSTAEGSETFGDFLRATRSGLFEAFDHQRFNFGQLIRHLPLPRDPSRVPLIGSTFNLNPPLAGLHYDGLRPEIALNPRAAYQFDLSFNCYEKDGALRVDCDFNTDLFDSTTIQRWLAHYRTLLAAIATAPETPLSKLPLIDDAERGALLQLGRGPANSYPADIALGELFARRAMTQPEALAIIENGQHFTYAEVQQRANQVAHYLLGLGLKPGEFVGLRSEWSARFIWEAVGVLRAGGAYVPVAADEPAERMKLIEETCAVLLLAPEVYAAASTASVDLTVDAGSPAYLLFTSGSTGIPKGVVVPHRAVTRLVWNTSYVEFRADDVVAFASNLNFDAATFEIWGALLLGGALLVTPQEILLSTADLEAHLTQHQVTILFLTTSLFNRTAQAAPAIFRRLRYMVFGGEAANAESVRIVLENGKPEHLVNGYGPTETTTFAICHEVQEVSGAFVPIGRPIANTDAFILDAHGEPVPRGVTGEIYVGGPGLALGYHRNSALTAERFLEMELGRLYRTGDLARWLPDGTIEYLGRRDQQIKLRGFRIEPGEIESALKQLPAIHDAAVILREDHGDPQLVAYCVRRKSEPMQPWPSDLAEALRTKLPKFMIPAAFVYLEHLPLTLNGKLDRAALPALALVVPVAQQIVPPTNSLQSQLIEIWEEVLKRQPIGIRDDFFAIGGHSLLAAQVVSLVTARLGHKLPFAEFFANPTIENHASALLRKQVTVENAPYVLINPHGTKTPVFFFHGDFIGGGFFCKTLARVIGEDRPFYALHPHGLQGEEVPTTIEAMAAERVRMIREIQPHGPYIIGGYCNGGLISFHAARLLRAADQEVGALLMLNADGTNVRFGWMRRLSGASSALRGEDDSAARRRFVQLSRRYSDHEAIGLYYLRAAVDLLKRPPQQQWERIWRKACRVLRRFKKDGSSHAKHNPSADALAASFPNQTIGDAYSSACHAFIPAIYDGPMTLFWPKDEPPPSRRGAASGWEKVCSRIAVVLVPGHHHSCISLNANVAQVGEAMRNAIQQAESLLSSTQP